MTKIETIWIRWINEYSHFYQEHYKELESLRIRLFKHSQNKIRRKPNNENKTSLF